eukprot:scaffold600_cov385-Prasinococcus_capsulatus_cf.AAC.6
MKLSHGAPGHPTCAWRVATMHQKAAEEAASGASAAGTSLAAATKRGELTWMRCEVEVPRGGVKHRLPSPRTAKCSGHASSSLDRTSVGLL